MRGLVALVSVALLWAPALVGASPKKERSAPALDRRTLIGIWQAVGSPGRRLYQLEVTDTGAATLAMADSDVVVSVCSSTDLQVEGGRLRAVWSCAPDGGVLRLSGRGVATPQGGKLALSMDLGGPRRVQLEFIKGERTLVDDLVRSQATLRAAIQKR